MKQCVAKAQAETGSLRPFFIAGNPWYGMRTGRAAIAGLLVIAHTMTMAAPPAAPSSEDPCSNLLDQALKAPAGEAIPLLRRAFAISGGARWAVSALALQMLDLQKRELWPEEAKVQDRTFTLAIAANLREMGSLDPAVSLYKVLLKADGTDREAAAGLLLTLARRVENPRALLEEMELSLLKDPLDTDMKVARAEVLFRLGQEEKAMEICESVLKDVPAHFAARALKARLLARKAGRTGAPSLTLLEEALRISERAPEMVAEYVKELSRSGRASEALAEYDRLPDLYEPAVDLLKAVAQVLQSQERHEEASELFSIALRKQSGAPDLASLNMRDVKRFLKGNQGRE